MSFISHLLLFISVELLTLGIISFLSKLISRFFGCDDWHDNAYIMSSTAYATAVTIFLIKQGIF